MTTKVVFARRPRWVAFAKKRPRRVVFAKDHWGGPLDKEVLRGQDGLKGGPNGQDELKGDPDDQDEIKEDPDGQDATRGGGATERKGAEEWGLPDYDRTEQSDEDVRINRMCQQDRAVQHGSDGPQEMKIWNKRRV